MHATKNKTKNQRGESPDVAVPRKSESPGLRSQHAHLTPGAVYAWTVTIWDQIVPVFFHSHHGHLAFEGQRMVLGGW